MSNVVSLRSNETSVISEARRPYLAYGLCIPINVRFNVYIHRQNGTIFKIEDTVLYDCLAADEEAVGLLYNKCTVELVGQNLLPLVELTKHFVFQFVEVFDPAVHLPPAEHEPVITRIRWNTVFHADDRLIPDKKLQSDVERVIMV